MTPKTGQRWYCPFCGKKYSANWGMLVQIVVNYESTNQHAFHVLTDCPPFEMEDIKALKHEVEMNPKTPQELFEMIPDRFPCLKDGVLREVDDAEVQFGRTYTDGRKKSYGCYRIEKMKELDALPKWPWLQIFNFTGIDKPPAILKEEKKLQKAQWNAMPPPPAPAPAQPWTW